MSKLNVHSWYWWSHSPHITSFFFFLKEIIVIQKKLAVAQHWGAVCNCCINGAQPRVAQHSRGQEGCSGKPEVGTGGQGQTPGDVSTGLSGGEWGSGYMNSKEHYRKFHKAEEHLQRCGGSNSSCPHINGLQACKFSANAQISSKIKLSNLLEMLGGRGGMREEKRKKGGEEDREQQYRIQSSACAQLLHIQQHCRGRD